MADDTLTVEQATKALGVAVLEYAVATAELPLREREPFAAAVGVARDALIAAVRAEQDEAHRLDQSFYALMNQKPDEETS